MGGRKWRGSLTGPRPANDVFPRVVAALEEPFTASAEEVSRRQNPGPGRPSSREGVGGRVQ
jgi:hypothetical protein